MNYLDVNWLAVLLATIASMALGAAWYMGLSRQWLAATGKTAEEIKAQSGADATPFIWSALMQLVMAYFLALLTPRIVGEVTIASTVIVGIHLWAGFMVTSMVMNKLYEVLNWSLELINGGYMIGIMIFQGVVIGLFG